MLANHIAIVPDHDCRVPNGLPMCIISLEYRADDDHTVLAAKALKQLRGGTFFSRLAKGIPMLFTRAKSKGHRPTSSVKYLSTTLDDKNNSMHAEGCRRVGICVTHAIREKC